MRWCRIRVHGQAPAVPAPRGATSRPAGCAPGSPFPVYPGTTLLPHRAVTGAGKGDTGRRGDGRKAVRMPPVRHPWSAAHIPFAALCRSRCVHPVLHRQSMSYPGRCTASRPARQRLEGGFPQFRLADRRHRVHRDRLSLDADLQQAGPGFAGRGPEPGGDGKPRGRIRRMRSVMTAIVVQFPGTDRIRGCQPAWRYGRRSCKPGAPDTDQLTCVPGSL